MWFPYRANPRGRLADSEIYVSAPIFSPAALIAAALGGVRTFLRITRPVSSRRFVCNFESADTTSVYSKISRLEPRPPREIEELGSAVRLLFRTETQKLRQSHRAVKNMSYGHFTLRQSETSNSNSTEIKKNKNSNVPLPPSSEMPKSRSKKFIDYPLLLALPTPRCPDGRAF